MLTYKVPNRLLFCLDIIYFDSDHFDLLLLREKDVKVILNTNSRRSEPKLIFTELIIE